MKKKYKNFSLMLHLDKNKCGGVEGSFNLISEAWGLLSDKDKIYDYDKKRNTPSFQLHQ